MSKKTLLEAARAILAETPATQDLQAAATTGQEPMHKEPGAAGNPDNSVHDLGGATTENPAGTSIGRAAAALVGKATPPGPTPPTAGDQTADHLHGDTGADKFPAAKASTAAQGNPAPLAPGAKEAGDTLYSEEEAKAERIAAIKEALKATDATSEIDEMFAGTELSAEFKAKVKTVFEAAIIARALPVVEALEAAMEADAQAALEEVKQELDEKVASYLDTMVEQWMSDNEVAIEGGLRQEISEEFISDLRTLFETHNMVIPEEQVSVVEQLAARVEELEGKLNESLNNNVTMTAELNKGKQASVLAVACEGLTATQADKLKTLAEGVAFTTEGEYTEKLKVIREQYFSGKGEGKTVVATPVKLDEATNPDPAPQSHGSAMDSYVAALSLTSNK